VTCLPRRARCLLSRALSFCTHSHNEHTLAQRFATLRQPRARTHHPSYSNGSTKGSTSSTNTSVLVLAIVILVCAVAVCAVVLVMRVGRARRHRQSTSPSPQPPASPANSAASRLSKRNKQKSKHDLEWEDEMENSSLGSNNDAQPKTVKRRTNPGRANNNPVGHDRAMLAAEGGVTPVVPQQQAGEQDAGWQSALSRERLRVDIAGATSKTNSWCSPAGSDGDRPTPVLRGRGSVQVTPTHVTPTTSGVPTRPTRSPTHEYSIAVSLPADTAALIYAPENRVYDMMSVGSVGPFDEPRDDLSRIFISALSPTAPDERSTSARRPAGGSTQRGDEAQPFSVTPGSTYVQLGGMEDSCDDA
jgi:hypothetical protein